MDFELESVSPEEFAKNQRQNHIDSLNNFAENLAAMSRLGDKLAERLRYSAEQLERNEVPTFKAGDLPDDEDNKQHTRLFISHGESCGMIVRLLLGGISDPFCENQKEFYAALKASMRPRRDRQ